MWNTNFAWLLLACPVLINHDMSVVNYFLLFHSYLTLLYSTGHDTTIQVHGHVQMDMDMYYTGTYVPV